MQDINNLIAEASQASSLSSREASLDKSTRDQLDAFVIFLMSVENKTENTARSYRSYIVTALTNDKTFAEQTSDVRSAIKALARFNES